MALSRESQTGLAVLGQTVWHQAAQAHGYPGSIEQRISLITLGVSDPARSRAFYEALGWLGQEAEDTVFFQVGGMVLVLWDRRKLAADAGVEDRTTEGFGGITLAHNVRTSGEVDELLALVEAAGATVTKPPATTFYGGYAGYFSDPDGHVWRLPTTRGSPWGRTARLSCPTSALTTDRATSARGARQRFAPRAPSAVAQSRSSVCCIPRRSSPRRSRPPKTRSMTNQPKRETGRVTS